jgi:hypothetical protein
MLDMKYPPKIASIIVVAVLSVAGLGLLTTAWGHGGKHGGWGHHGHQCERHGSGGAGRFGPDRLAGKLSAMETEIGIRVNQIDAWRDFTDALLATMKPPFGPGAGMMPPPDETAEPFALAEHAADNAIARGKSGEDLKKAITALKTTLTPEQLDKVKAIEARVRAHMHHRRGPFGPPSPDAGAGPDAGPPADAPDQPDAPDDSGEQ